MPILFQSSGDLVADRRYGFARDLADRGDLAEAADLLGQAVALAPRFASAWFALGEIHERLGLTGEAAAAFAAARDSDPADVHGATLRLMRLGVADLAAMPADYVRTLFDQYADRFEASLVGALGYRGPALLHDAVRAVCGPRRFVRAVDCGCGTGLAARAFAGDVDRFVGIDLSPRMVAQARATGLYAELAVADMVAGLAAQPAGAADLVLAADAVVYLPDVAPLAQAAARALTPGGVLAFTAETHGGAGVVLGPGLRYAHAPAHLRDALSAAGLTLAALIDASARDEDGVPAPGIVAVALKPA